MRLCAISDAAALTEDWSVTSISMAEEGERKMAADKARLRNKLRIVVEVWVTQVVSEGDGGGGSDATTNNGAVGGKRSLSLRSAAAQTSVVRDVLVR